MNPVERLSRRILLGLASAAVVLAGCAVGWVVLQLVGIHLPAGTIVLAAGALLTWLVLGGGTSTPAPAPTVARGRAPEARARWADLLIAAELLRDGLIDETEYQQVRTRVAGLPPKGGEGSTPNLPKDPRLPS